jgi:FixJ family two-component response regulator
MSIEGPLVKLEMQRGTEPPLIGIVDDDKSIREGLSSIIRSAGYRTAVFESAEAFLEGDHKHEVRCLVLDIDMPGLGGLDLQRQLGRMNVAIPIIFATAQNDVSGALALTEGAGAVLGKPFTEEAILGAIRSAMDFPKHLKRRK